MSFTPPYRTYSAQLDLIPFIGKAIKLYSLSISYCCFRRDLTKLKIIFVLAKSKILLRCLQFASIASRDIIIYAPYHATLLKFKANMLQDIN